MTDDIEQSLDHRPFPLPGGPWVMFQSWQQLLFAHWPVPFQDLRPLVPPELELEQFQGTAWIGLTPFRLSGLRMRLLPAVPGVSEFPEMNLRTYVRVGDKPGIFFFSLDAGSSLAVAGARLGFRLPYFRADMSIEQVGDWFHYRSRRLSGGNAEFVGRYRPTGPVFNPRRDTLEHFLTERYALYTVLRNGRVLRGEIHHRPWPLQLAEADIDQNTVARAHGIELPQASPLLHFANRQDTLIWPPSIGG